MELPSRPEWKRLGDVAEIIMGQSPPGCTYNLIGQGMPFLQGKAEFGDVLPRHIKYTNKPLKVAPKGSVLISVRAPVGDVNIANIDYCIGRGLASISLYDGDNNFLFYFLTYYKDRLENEGVGSTFKAISKSKLQNFRIPFPPLEIQRKIVAILEKAEAMKKFRAQADELINQLLQSVFLEMFGDPVKNTKNWQIDSLENKCIKITDGEHLNPKLEPVGRHVILAGDVLENGVAFSSNKFVSEGDFQKFIKKCNPEKNDLLLVSRGATIGRCTSIRTDTPFCLMGSVILIKPKNISHFYLEYLFKNHNFIRKVINLSSASAQQAIYLKHIKKLQIPVPPSNLQDKFEFIVNKLEKLNEGHKQTREEIENLFNVLMQKAFTGELVA